MKGEKIIEVIGIILFFPFWIQWQIFKFILKGFGMMFGLGGDLTQNASYVSGSSLWSSDTESSNDTSSGIPEPSGTKSYTFRDSQGYLCESGNVFHDAKGNLCEPGGLFYDAKGNLCDSKSLFYDSKGYLCEPGGPFHDADGNLINPRG